MEFNLAQSERVAGEKGVSVQQAQKKAAESAAFWFPELAEIYFSG